IADGALDKAPLAVAEIKLPEGNELLRVAQGADGGEVGVEPVAPALQRLGVVGADILQVKQTHVGMASHGGGEGGHRGQKAAGEYIALNEIHRAAVTVVEVVGDSD